VRFSLSDDQRELQRTVRDFVADRFSIERVAEIADGEGWDSSMWPEVAELGWLGIGVAEDAGGLGMSFVEEALVLEELGRALFPGPHLSTSLALPFLTALPEVAEAVVGGKQTATLAWATGSRGDVRARGAAETSLEGTVGYVPDLATADLVVIAADVESGPAAWLVQTDADGLERKSLPTVDATRRLGMLSLADTPATALEVSPDLLHGGRVRAHAALAAEAVGVAQRALEYGVEHARTREQFGRAIGVYQAVSHRLVDSYVAVESARSLAYWAAWMVANEADGVPEAAAAAHSLAADAAVAACESAIQVHGGIGFTWEHPLHRFYKRAMWISSWLGSPATQRARVAVALLD
jgi:acyl-CoA dehydrogenase